MEKFERRAGRCPFCDGAAMLMSEERTYWCYFTGEFVPETWYLVRCFDCRMSGPGRYSAEEAISEWNACT